MPRTPPPAGYVTLSDALKRLHERGLQVSEGMIYKYAEAGRIKRHGPEKRKQKYYSIAELDKLADEELGINLQQHIEVSFARASLDDLEGITRLSAKLFNTSTLTPISTETRRAWLLKEPRGHYVVKRPNGEVVAYLHMLALTDERIADYMAGRIMGRNLTGDDVQMFTPGRPVSVIVASIGSDPDLAEALRTRCTGILLHGVSLDIALLGLQGIIIPRLYAWSESKDGIAMCARMGMQQYAPPMRMPQGPRRYTFYLDVLNTPTPMMQGYQRALAEWQAMHGAPAASPAPERATMPKISPASITPPQRKQASSQPSEAHRDVSKRRRPRISPKEELPADYVSAPAFAADHGINPRSLRHAIEEGRLQDIRGEWKLEHGYVRHALDQAGQQQFYALFHDRPAFTPCPRCPHIAE
jgi:hypothetical protein